MSSDPSRHGLHQNPVLRRSPDALARCSAHASGIAHAGGIAARANFTDKDIVDFLVNVECLEGLFDTWGTFGHGFIGVRASGVLGFSTAQDASDLQAFARSAWPTIAWPHQVLQLWPNASAALCTSAAMRTAIDHDTCTLHVQHNADLIPVAVQV